MSDKELLELAAKACEFGTPNKVTGRLQHCWTESEYPKRSGKVGALWGYKGWGDDAELWNPLTDDGDALRLAVKLKIDIGWVGGQVAANNACEIGDYAATRRAIVRAAAEIGKAMP